MNVNIVTTIDNLTEISSTNKKEMYKILKINKKSNTIEAKKFLRNFVREIDDGNFNYFSKNTKLVRVEATYQDNENRILKSRKIRRSVPILGIKVKQGDTEYSLFYDVSTLPADSTFPVISCIEDRITNDLSYQERGPNLFSIQAEKEGYQWLLAQRETRVPKNITKVMISKNNRKYASLYAIRG